MISKVCERAAHSQVMNCLGANGVIHHLQSGNRNFYSTEASLLYFTDELLKNMDEKTYLLLYSWTCQKPLTVFGTTKCCVNFAKPVCQNPRVLGLQAIYHSVSKLLRY